VEERAIKREISAWPAKVRTKKWWKNKNSFSLTTMYFFNEIILRTFHIGGILISVAARQQARQQKINKKLLTQ
jgi:hypothetical protein